MTTVTPTLLDAMPVTELSGVGPAVAEKLRVLGMISVQDVLFHLPHRYQDRTQVAPIAALEPGAEGVVSAEVVLASVVQGRRRSLLVRITDGTGSLVLRFFHFNKSQLAQFQVGAKLECFGEVRRGPAQLELVHPEYRMLSQGSLCEDTLTPFYPATEGVQQGLLRKLTEQALELLNPENLIDLLPAEHISQYDLFPLQSALRTVHRPPPDADVDALVTGLHPAHRRLALEELIAHRLGLRLLRVRVHRHCAPVIAPSSLIATQLLAGLPYSLTQAQQRVIGEIAHDLGSGEPMLRLVQGDVGAGKTIVAACAAADAVSAGYQVALMAPTEILAEQHLLNFTAWFEPLGVRVGWLSGKMRASQRRSSIENIALGQLQIVIGTHALFQQDVEFANLGLVIIDEQHRFGVHQRLALRNKGASGELLPHQLVMTATPIPRTLAMTAYADLDCSIIDELPPGRKPVQTVAMEASRRAQVVERVAVALAQGRQVYWVCTLVEESESLQAEAADDTAVILAEQLPDFQIGLVHGRLKPAEKELVMQAFKQHDISLLVATTVIEVGVDVPNASLMVIENAERLGLSQLHQLRGRVGRGREQSSCILLYQAPLSQSSKERIAIMRETNDGFVIAQKDLDLRGAGEVLGTKQTGLAEFRIAQLSRDADLLDTVSDIADALLAQQPKQALSIIRRWIGEDNHDYGAV